MSISFTQALITANRLDERGFRTWIFLPGMVFGAVGTWWGSKAARPRPHQGIDLHTFLDDAGQNQSLAAGTLIPSLLDGQVVAIFPDFLGHSLLMAHHRDEAGWRLHSILAHVAVEPGIVCGRQYPAGTTMASIAASPRAGVSPHLHLTTLALSAPLREPISWSSLAEADGVRLIDPMPWLEGRADNSRGTADDF